MTRADAAELAEVIHGARVVSATVVAGVLVLELFHRGTDDDAYRLAIPVSAIVADAWPWPQAEQAS